MKFVSLLKATSFSGLRVSPFDGVKQYLSTGDLQENDISLVDILYEEKPSRADIFVNEGDILFARMKGTIKVLEITQKLSGIIVSTGFAVIRPNNEFISQYLYFYLKSDAFQRQKDKYCSGAIQPAITNAGLGKIKVPLLPLEVQKRTAYLLCKIELLIKQRKQSLQHLDDFIKSVFLDMFGDPVKNENNWEVKPCKQVVINIESGTSYGGEERVFLNEDEYGVLKISAVTQGWFNAYEIKAVKKSIITKSLKFIKTGDFLFSRANTVELIAACCIVKNDHPNLFLPDKLWSFSFSDFIQPQYFNHLLKNEGFRNTIRKKASGGHDSMLNISMEKFRSLDVPVPPIELQNQFATIVEKVEKIKEQNQQSLTELENLYGAVSQKAFKGELDLEKIPLIEVPQTQQYFDNINKEQDTQTITQAKSSRYLYPFLKGVDILTVKGRLELIKFWFEQFFKNIKKGNPLSIEAFWQNAQFNFEPYRDKQFNIAEKNNNSDEVDAINNLNLGIQEYDFLKTLIFEKLDEGLLHQELSEVEKVELAQLTNENDLDTKNTIILKK